MAKSNTPNISNEDLLKAAQEAYDLLTALSSKLKFAGYALTYLAAMLDEFKMTQAAHMSMATLEKTYATQCLYVLSNVEQWRGEDAKRLKAIFKAYAKQNG